jgi:hypothetical protein
MLGCLFALWLLFMAGMMFLLVVGVVFEYPGLAVIAAVVLGLWWLARGTGASKPG